MTTDERASSITGVAMAGVAVAALVTLAVLEEMGNTGGMPAPERQASNPDTRQQARPRSRSAARRNDPAPVIRQRADSATQQAGTARQPASRPVPRRPPLVRPERVTPPAVVERPRLRRPPTRPSANPNASPPPPRRRPRRAAISPATAHPMGHDFRAITSLTQRKKAFIAALLPIVQAENQRLLQQRQKAETRPTAAMYRRYKVKPGNRRALLKRLDAVPASMAIAQAAIESGWGTSRFLRQANNLFGERTYKKGANGLTPREATGFKITVFRSVAGSVRSYMHNLNSNAAYAKFRDARAVKRRSSGTELVGHLNAYSELRGTYIAMVRKVIETNGLKKLDYARVANR